MRFVFRPKARRLYRGRYRIGDDPRLHEVALKTPRKEIAEEKLRQIVREREEEALAMLPPKGIREGAQTHLVSHLHGDAAAVGFSKDFMLRSSKGDTRAPSKQTPIDRRHVLRLRNSHRVVNMLHSLDGRVWTKHSTHFEILGYHHNAAGGFPSLRPAPEK